MLAGFAEIEITPKSGNMPGEFGIYTATEGSIGGLYANAAAFTSGEQSLIFLSVDVLFFTDKLANSVRRRITEATGVPAQNILSAGIHIHTGGPIDCQCWGTPAEPENAAIMGDKMVEVAIAAWNNRAEAKLGTSMCYDPRFSFCRDYCMDDGFIKTNVGYAKAPKIRGRAGVIDTSVNVMRVDDSDGKIKCFIVNYANHPDNEPMPRTRYSADYIGYMRRELKRVYGDDVIVLYFNGTAGDVNAADFWHHTDAWYKATGNCPKVVGEELAKDIVNMSFCVDVTEPYIDTISNEHRVLTRKPTQENLDWAESVKDKMGKGELLEHEEAYAETYLNYDEATWPEDDYIEVQTIRFGPWTIVGIASELYSEIGLRIKRDSVCENTLVFQMANGIHGYIPTDYILDSKAYPSKWGSVVTYLAKGTADTIIEKSLEQLEEVKKNEDK